MTFEQAFKAMPKFLTGFDPFHHKSPIDLYVLARHEMDLHDEGKIKLTAKQLRSLSQYIRMLRRENNYAR